MSSTETGWILGLSLCFVLGFTTVFLLLGPSPTALSGLLRTHLDEANLIGAGNRLGAAPANAGRSSR